MTDYSERGKRKRDRIKKMPNLPKEVEADLRRAGGLDHIVDDLPEHNNLVADANLHRALANPTRLRILHSLVRCSLCPCILKEITELSDSKLSYHLNILEKVKLIESFPQKKWRIYVLTELGKSLIKDE